MNLGIIGLSSGNGHPYSWSAIFNGYNKDEMSKCGFPAIPEYLSSRQFPEDQIHGSSVTHVWSDSFARAEHIAKASNIPNVVEHYEDMVGKVDGLLLARDDAENHEKYARPFIEAGIPVYIDKPFALTSEAANKLLSMQKYSGQIFSCSALKYAEELQLKSADLKKLGTIRFIDAIGPSIWDKYAIHLIDPVLDFEIKKGVILESTLVTSGELTSLLVKYENDLLIRFTTTGGIKSGFVYKIYGENSSAQLEFKDSFCAFKATLEKFVGIASNTNVMSMPMDMLAAVDLIERGWA